MSDNLLIPKSVDVIVENVLGPTSKEIGEDIKTLYQKGRDLILLKAFKKLKDPQDNKTANLRVARDVFWNGSFTDEAICAEYFGGILASSRSADGKDDSGIYYTDIIKSLSSHQLLLHYVIYRALNLLWNEKNFDKEKPNVGLMSDLAKYYIWFTTIELEKTYFIDIEKDLIALYNKGLVGDSYEAKGYKLENGAELPYTKVQPSTLGIQLYATANNRLSEWRNFTSVDFEDFSEIKNPKYFAFSIEDLLIKIGIKKDGSKI